MMLYRNINVPTAIAMLQNSIVGHRYLQCIDSASSMSEDRGIRTFVRSIIEDMSRPILGEDVVALQRKLDTALVGHATSVRRAFEKRYPGFDLDLAWNQILNSGERVRFPSNVDDEFLTSFVNVSAWVKAEEGGKRRSNGFPLIKLCDHIGKDADQVRGCVLAVTFETVCGVCGHIAIVKAHAASLKRTLLATTVECLHCHHKDVVARATARRNLDFAGLFRSRLECQCTTCVGIRRHVCDSAKDVDAEIARTVSVLASWFRSNMSQLIPDLQNAALSDEQRNDFNLIEQELFERNGSLAEAIKRLCNQEYQEASSVLLEDYVLRGIGGGYLKALNIRWLNSTDSVEQDIWSAIDQSEDWIEGYSLSRFIDDMHSGDVNRILHACSQFSRVNWIKSPVISDIAYVGSESGVLRQMASTLHQMISTLETGSIDPSVQISMLSEVRDRLLSMSPLVR